jgi:hypothetical protein
LSVSSGGQGRFGIGNRTRAAPEWFDRHFITATSCWREKIALRGDSLSPKFHQKRKIVCADARDERSTRAYGAANFGAAREP